jgi:SWI/SNF-related matrix-associated actin-dependent regulator of chromatin subfamily A member 5
MCELLGRNNCDQYTELYALGKTKEQIKEYSDAFWANYTKIKNYQKYIERIERGEQELNKRNSIDQAIEDKFAQLRQRFLESNPNKTLADFTYRDIEIKYQRPPEGDLAMFDFSETEDKIYAMGMHKFTYGFFELIKNSLRNYAELRLDWAAQTRTADEIQQRCDFLIAQFQAELTGKVVIDIAPQFLEKPQQAKVEMPVKLPQKRGRKPKNHNAV